MIKRTKKCCVVFTGRVGLSVKKIVAQEGRVWVRVEPLRRVLPRVAVRDPQLPLLKVPVLHELAVRDHLRVAELVSPVVHDVGHSR